MDISSLLSLSENNSFKPPKQSKSITISAIPQGSIPTPSQPPTSSFAVRAVTNPPDQSFTARTFIDHPYLNTTLPYGDSRPQITHHSAIRAEGKEQGYKCMHPSCQKIKPFTHSKHLRRHETNKHQLHGGSKQYFCVVPDCRASQRPFDRKENLTAHLKVHAKTNAPTLTRRTCDGCRGSKVKCSGGRPCEHCVRKNIPCTIVMNIDPSLGNKISTSKTSDKLPRQALQHSQTDPSHNTGPSNSKGRSRKAWNEDEDKLLLDLKKTLSNWNIIAAKFPGRSGGACRERYSDILRNLAWNDDQEAQLAYLYNINKKKMFQMIAIQMGLSWQAVELKHWTLGQEGINAAASLSTMPAVSQQVLLGHPPPTPTNLDNQATRSNTPGSQLPAQKSMITQGAVM